MISLSELLQLMALLMSVAALFYALGRDNGKRK